LVDGCEQRLRLRRLADVTPPALYRDWIIKTAQSWDRGR
jgi:hypothetical protein